MCPLAGLRIVRCTCSLPERLALLGAGSVRIERLNMSYLHISRLSRSWQSATLAFKSGSVSMQKDAPDNANDLSRCSPDEVSHVHLPVKDTAPIGVKAVEGSGHTKEAFMQAWGSTNAEHTTPCLQELYESRAALSASKQLDPPGLT